MKRLHEKAGRVLLGASLIGLAGLGIRQMSKYRMPEPKKLDYSFIDGRTAGGDVIIDSDRDGDADYIMDSPNNTIREIIYVAPDMVEKLEGVDLRGKTLRMTGEIQDLATQILKLQRELAYEMDHEKYDRFQEQKKEKNQ